MSIFSMPPHPVTGLINVTHEEVSDALAAQDELRLVREDGTLTIDGMFYVAAVRRMNKA